MNNSLIITGVSGFISSQRDRKANEQ